MSLMDKLKKNSKIKETIALEQSVVFDKKNFITTDVPMINLALSGEIDGGLAPGLTVLAGPSKHFKTSYGLVMLKAFLDKEPEGVILFYDTEFGSPMEYFSAFGVDTSRIIHTPIMNVEELKFDIMNQLEGLEKKDKVLIFLDSMGNMASKKEVEDALAEKSVADMSRAKQFKSLFRMVTPHLKTKDIPFVVINHTYMEQGMFPKAIVGGGTGVMYSADTIFIIGKSTNKKGTEIEGYNFTINIEKSRFVKEKAKFPVKVSWEGGIVQWAGFLDDAIEGGYVEKPSNGYYTRPCVVDDKKWREAQTETKEWWEEVLSKTDFSEYLKKKYKVSHTMPADAQTDMRDVEVEIDAD